MSYFLDSGAQVLLQESEQRMTHEIISTAVDTSSATIQGPSNSRSLHAMDKLAVRIPNAGPSARQVKDSAGPNWFNLPKTQLSEEFKREWQLLRMRGVLDPKHQKKALRPSPPEYSQVGEIIVGASDFYSARLTRKARKRTLLDRSITEHDEMKLQSKYADIQRNKTSGRKAFYQRLMSQRRNKLHTML